MIVLVMRVMVMLVWRGSYDQSKGQFCQGYMMCCHEAFCTELLNEIMSSSIACLVGSICLHTS